MSMTLKKTRKKFLQLTITKKMLLGFLPLFILTVLMASYALTSLTRLNRINRSIVNVDIPLMQSADTMIDRLISQELRGRHYIILKSPQNMELFTESGRDFETQVRAISALPGLDQDQIDRLYRLHEEYVDIFMDWFKAADAGDTDTGEVVISLDIGEMSRTVQPAFYGCCRRIREIIVRDIFSGTRMRNGACDPICSVRKTLMAKRDRAGSHL